MTWAVLVPIILQYGVPFAEQLYTLATSSAAPTAADWAKLSALASTNAQAQMLTELAAAGIDPTSAQGKSFMALVV